jgi:endonuclease/exonuclease/phosphatase (EEP) superfamily protein YafD
MVWVQILSREEQKILTALKSNSNTVWFNFQTYIKIYIQVSVVLVMGDFNVDLLSRKDDVITHTFSAFEQNIKSSITRKLTCLDHVYTRHLNAQQAGVVPIYYSYHDMTYIM